MANYIRFLLMQDREVPDNAKHFFAEVNELYLKVLLDPFYKVNTRISSTVFRQRISQLLKKYFPN
ncbi:Trafficking protein particle complex subunit 2 [Diplonema papillatum]|nr:Trafficking protein particle complex subunit 2 [Diplonema papillatum]